MKELKANMNSQRASRTNQKYRDDNKERKQEYMKQYNEDNKDQINEKNTCKCGCEVVKHTLKRHERTKKTYGFNQSNSIIIFLFKIKYYCI